MFETFSALQAPRLKRRGFITVFFPKQALNSFFPVFFCPGRSLIVLLLPTKIVHEAELLSLLRKTREKKVEPDALLTPEFVQMLDLSLQLTHIWPQNPELAVLLAQRSIQRRHRAILPSLGKTLLFRPTCRRARQAQHAKLWFLVVGQKGRKCYRGPSSERERPPCLTV